MTGSARRLRVLALAALLLGALGIFLVMFTQLAGAPLPLISGGGYRITALIDQALQLVPGSEVRDAGIKIGQVTAIRPYGELAAVTMRLDANHPTIYRDATVQTRLRTPLGETYVQLTPGSPSAGVAPSGATLPAADTAETVAIDQVIDTLDPSTRRRVKATLRAFGAALDGQGENVNQALAGLSGGVSIGSPVLRTLADQSAEVATLVRDTATVLQAIANRTQDLRTLIDTVEQAASAAAARDHALGQALAVLPGTLSQVRTTVARLSDLSIAAVPVVSNLRAGVAGLAPVVRQLIPAATAGRELFERLPAALRATNPLIDQLKPLACVAIPTVDQLGEVLRQANPALSYLSPYGPDLAGLFANMGSVFTKAPTGNGTLPGPDTFVKSGHVHLQISVASLTGLTAQQKALLDALAKDGVLQMITPLPTVYYPKAGSGQHLVPAFTGPYPHILALPPLPRTSTRMCR